MSDPLSEQQRLLEQLQNPILFDHPVKCFEVIETHISWVLLTGFYAYKIKKPVNFGFLDFSTLEKRHFYCEEELRLNRRLARQIYLEVVTISRSGDRLALNGQGEAIEYAVKMIEFPQSAQLDSLSAGGQLDDHLMDKLAERVAAFHLSSESASEDNDYGGVVRVQKAVMENFAHLRDSVKDPAIVRRLGKLEQWSRSQIEQLAEIIAQRKIEGFVRLCHGDMHLRNIAVWDGEIIIFDCIEFNKDLHLIDVISEIAFLVMDLEARKHGELANFFLNKYIEITGDYEGLKLLRFYKVYRALVRAKVDILRTFQEPSGSAEYDRILNDFVNYVRMAEQYSRVHSPHLMINYGLSGSGKSAVSRSLATRFSAIQIRSDVERKRLFAKEQFGHNGLVEQGPYDPDATWKVYSHLARVAKLLLRAGYPVIIDATNLKAVQRQRFSALARSLEIPWCILFFTAPVDTLRERIYKRMREGNDVSDATADILEHQMTTGEPLTEKEQLFTLTIDTEQDVDVAEIVRGVERIAKISTGK